MKRILVLAVLIVGVGCGDENPPATPEASPAVRDQPTEVEMVATMEAHYSVVILALIAAVMLYFRG